MPGPHAEVGIRRLEHRRQPQPHQLRHDRRKDYGLIVRRLSWSLTPHR